MARYPSFIGGSATSRSIAVDDQRTVNLFAELVESGAGKNRVYLLGTPGVTPFAQIVTTRGAVCRASFAEDGRAFCVMGGTFYEVFADGTFVQRGVMTADANPATICSSGSGGDHAHELFLTSGGHGYIYNLDSNTLTEIIAEGFPSPCLMGTWIDGYFIALKTGSTQFNISGFYDGLAWDALDLGQREQGSDAIAAIVAIHRELWILGTKTSEVWFNNGDADFPFTPVQGVFIQRGCGAPFSVRPFDNTLVWIDADDNGSGLVVKANGYRPERISTHYVEFAFKTYDTLADSIGFTYQQEGHTFYLLYVPSADVTWCFDGAVPPAIAWHERALWDSTNCVWLPWVGRNHMFAFDTHLIGDRRTGTLYELRLDTYADTLVLEL